MASAYARAFFSVSAALPKNIAMGLTAATSALVASPAFALVRPRATLRQRYRAGTRAARRTASRLHCADHATASPALQSLCSFACSGRSPENHRLAGASFFFPLLNSPFPAPAQVDDRLNGDGAGIALGVNDPILGAHLLGVFTAIWALYYIANNSDDRIQAGGKDDDSGLSL